MNRIYRLVFNRTLGVLQVASELSRSHGSGHAGGGRRSAGRRHPLALACASLFALGLASLAWPAMAATCVPDNTHICGVNGQDGQDTTGGVGSNPGLNNGGNGSGGNDGGNGGGIGGGAGGSYFGGDSDGGSGGHGGGHGGNGEVGSGAGGGGGGLENGGVGGGGGGGGNVDASALGGGGGGGGGLGILLSTNLQNSGMIEGGAGGAGAISDGSGFGWGGGGGGGAAVLMSGTNQLENTGTLQGGMGGGSGTLLAGAGGGGGAVLMLAGGSFINHGTVAGGAGGGGAVNFLGGGGGDGVAAAAATSQTILSNDAGGIRGGNGGDCYNAYGDTTAGDGGTGILSGGNLLLSNAAIIQGGNGGNGLYLQDAAGNGGAGLVVGGSGNGSNDSDPANGYSGLIIGGNGGSGGNGQSITNGGAGGNGGAGVELTGFNLVNTAIISGGAGGLGGAGIVAGANGLGGAGVVAHGGSQLINSGNIMGGMGGDGITQAAAIQFSGGGNTLVLEAGSNINGNVISSSGTMNGGDTLTLGGDSIGGAGNGSFNVAGIVATLPTSSTGTQYVGFANFSKAGTSAWTLTNSQPFTTPSQNWTVADGDLVADTGSLQGNVTFDPASAGANPTLTFDQTNANPNLTTYNGTISGDGSVVVTGNNTTTLTLATANSYTGGTTIDKGTVVVQANGVFGSGPVTINSNGNMYNSLVIAFYSGSSAGNLHFTNAGFGIMNFAQGATAGNAIIDNTGDAAETAFNMGTDAGNATITNSGTYSYVQFNGASAADAIILNEGQGLYTARTVFDDDYGSNSTSSAGTASITNSNGGATYFYGHSDAGSATLINQVGGIIQFQASSTAAGAAVANGAGGEVDVLYRDATATDLSIGSLSGDGDVVLGNAYDVNYNVVQVSLTLGALGQNDTIGGVISDANGQGGSYGDSLIKTGSGVLTLNGVNTYTGDTSVQSGTLLVGDSTHEGAVVAGNIGVESGATLGGHGTIGGDVDVQMDGHLAPGGSIGTLTVGGNLNLAQGSQLDFEFGAPGADFNTAGSSDSVHVGGNLQIDGATLDITDAGGMGPGVYTLFSYDGTLAESNGGILLASPNSGYTIQTLTADRQIDLLDTEGLTLNFWNANGEASGAQRGGGSGTWSTTSPTWTDATGSVTAAMSPQPGFAIFGGAAGTVSVDDSLAAVSATGLQFTTDGYTVAGDTLTLVGSNGTAPVIRVGAGDTATLASVLAGTDGFNATDNGTLVLSATNTYTGNTVLTGGTVSVAADANLGAASSGLDFEGGTLEITGTRFTQTARDITWGAPGGGFDIDDAANTFTVTQALTGTGSLLKSGAGTLVLAGTNTYNGGTMVSAGTLQGDTTSLQGDIIDNAIVAFAQQGDGTYAGAMSGTGSLIKTGSGTLTLSGTNTYNGGTTVSAGTLQGDTTSLQGDIIDNATVAFAQQGDGTYAGAMSGTGNLIKTGSGTLTLSGANTYAGGTTVSAGTLQGDTTSLQGDIIDNATIAFAQQGDGTYAGAMSGTGSLVKTGSGTLTLSGANTYSGGTMVSAGTLQGDTSSLQGDIIDNATIAFAQQGDGTYAGAMSGTGSLIKTGSGTLTLNGANAYTGGTTVSAGTLQGDTSSLQGNIIDNATLAFVQSNDGVFAGTLTGTGALTKSGDGTLTFNGDDTLSGSVDVTAGKLIVGDDSHASASLDGMVTIGSDATLGGIGHVGGLDLSGTLTPGNSIGTLNVAGNAVFEKGSSYQIDVAPDGTSDRIAISGSASILGGSVLALGSSGDWAPQTSYSILTADGGVSGTFSSISSNLAFLTPTLSYSTNAVGLTLQRNDILFADVAQTANQRATAAGAESLGFGHALYGALVTLDAVTARRAFDQLSGESYASSRTALVDDSRYVRDAIDRHLLGLDESANGVHASSGDVTAWTSAWGHWGSNDSDGNAAQMQANGSGLLVGADLAVGSAARLGAVAGHTQSSVQVDDRGSTSHGTGTSLGVYGDVSFGGFALRGGAAYAWQDVDSTRSVAFGTFHDLLKSDYHAHTAQAFVEGGYQFQVSANQQLEPFLNVARVQLQTDAADEGDSAAALRIAGDSSNVNTATLGLRDTLTLDAASGIHAHGSIGWQQAWGDLTPMSRTRFAAGGDSFAITGVPVAQHALAVDAGVSFRIGRNVSVDTSYVGQFASHAKDQGARMNLRVDF